MWFLEREKIGNDGVLVELMSQNPQHHWIVHQKLLGTWHHPQNCLDVCFSMSWGRIDPCDASLLTVLSVSVCEYGSNWLTPRGMIGVYKVTQRVEKDLPYSMRPVTEEKLAGHDAIGTRPVELHLGLHRVKRWWLGTPYFIYQGSELGPASWVFYVFQRFYPLMAIEIYYPTFSGSIRKTSRVQIVLLWGKGALI